MRFAITIVFTLLTLNSCHVKRVFLDREGKKNGDVISFQAPRQRLSKTGGAQFLSFMWPLAAGVGVSQILGAVSRASGEEYAQVQGDALFALLFMGSMGPALAFSNTYYYPLQPEVLAKWYEKNYRRYALKGYSYDPQAKLVRELDLEILRGKDRPKKIDQRITQRIYQDTHVLPGMYYKRKTSSNNVIATFEGAAYTNRSFCSECGKKSLPKRQGKEGKTIDYGMSSNDSYVSSTGKTVIVKKVFKPDLSAEKWIADYNRHTGQQFVHISSFFNDNTRTAAITAIDLSKEKQFAITSLEDAQLYKKYFPEGRYADLAIANGADRVRADQIPDILEMYPKTDPVLVNRLGNRYTAYLESKNSLWGQFNALSPGMQKFIAIAGATVIVAAQIGVISKGLDAFKGNVQGGEYALRQQLGMSKDCFDMPPKDSDQHDHNFKFNDRIVTRWTVICNDHASKKAITRYFVVNDDSSYLDGIGIYVDTETSTATGQIKPGPARYSFVHKNDISEAIKMVCDCD